MKVILLERVLNLGFIGDVVGVKRGFARNFLIPRKKALRANEQSKKYFESMKAEIEAENLRKKNEAEKVASRMSDLSLSIIRNASETGMLFGSVRPNDIIEACAEKGMSVSKKQISISSPIRTIGNHMVSVVLHPDVKVDINVRIMTTQEQGASVMEEETDVSMEDHPKKHKINKA